MNGDDTKNNSGATRTWPFSDHFDGKRFFNPSLPRNFDTSAHQRLQDVA